MGTGWLRSEDYMKIWEKIYLFVIILFLLVLNICNIIVFRSSYEKSLESVENTAVSFWRHIASSMTEDMAEIGLNSGERKNFVPNRRAERRLRFLPPKGSCSRIF